MPFLHAKAIAEPARSRVPVAGRPIEFAPKAPVAFQIDNGLTVYVLEKRGLPLVAASLIVRGGSAADPEGSAGLTALMLEAAKLGTQTRSATAIAEQMEALGTSLDVSTSMEAQSLSTEALSDSLPTALEVMADVALNPRFAADEVKRAQAARQSELRLRDSEPGGIARRLARKAVFGNHPYAHDAAGDAAEVAALSAKDLVQQHRALFSPTQAALLFVGDVNDKEAEGLAEQYFGHWKASNAKAAAPQIPPPADLPATIWLVDRPGAPQAECVVAGLGVSRAAPEYPALVLGNAVLGGMFNSRINMNLREAKGWTYGARSSLAGLTQRGLFSINSAIRSDVAADGLAEMFREFDKMEAEAPSPEELRAAQNRHVLSVAGTMETVADQSQQLATLFVHGLPLTYWHDLPKQLSAVHQQDVLTAMRAALPVSRMSVVVVGDRSKLEEKMLGLKRGSVEHRDVRGRLLAGKSAKVGSKVAPQAGSDAPVADEPQAEEAVEENADDDAEAAAEDERRVNAP